MSTSRITARRGRSQRADRLATVCRSGHLEPTEASDQRERLAHGRLIIDDQRPA